MISLGRCFALFECFLLLVDVLYLYIETWKDSLSDSVQELLPTMTTTAAETDRLLTNYHSQIAEYEAEVEYSFLCIYLLHSICFPEKEPFDAIGWAK